MLQKTAKLVADCHRRAAECAERARCAQTPGDRQFYLDMERHWLMLADSYELTDRLGSFRSYVDRRTNKQGRKAACELTITRFLRNEALDSELLEAMSAALGQACRVLGVSIGENPMTELVADHIIEAALRGMRTKTAFYLTAVIKFRDCLQ